MPGNQASRLRRLDAAASRAADVGARGLAVATIAFVLIALIAIPVITKGPGVILTAPVDALIDFGLNSNESNADYYGDQLEVDNLNPSPPDGCDPEQVTSYDAPAPGKLYVTPEGGC